MAKRLIKAVNHRYSSAPSARLRACIKHRHAFDFVIAWNHI